MMEISKIYGLHYVTGFMETVPNCTLNVSTRTKFTQKVDHFTVFESFPITSCCPHNYPPSKIEKFGWLDVQGSIRDVYIGWVGGGGWTGGKRFQFKIVLGHQ